MTTSPNTSNWICRKSEERDDLAVGELLVRAFSQTYAEKMPDVVLSDRRLSELRDAASRRNTMEVLVLERVQDGLIGGTMTLVPWSHPDCKAWPPKHVESKMFVVAPEFQKLGIGALLIEAGIQKSRDLGAHGICIQVRRGATGLARGYEKIGFRRDPHGDEDHLPEIFLEGYTLTLLSA